MSHSSREKILIGVLILLIVGYFGYQMFSGGSAPAAVSVSTTDSSATSSGVVGQDILTLVLKLQNISIDSSLFSSPLWTALKDSAAPLSPESQGRTDPFAALGSENAVAGPATTKTAAKTQ